MQQKFLNWQWLALLSLPLVLGFSACGITIDLSGGGASGGVGTGGVFYSGDKGENWEQRVLVSETQKSKVTIGGANIMSLTFFPDDSRVIYAGTRENGAYRTIDAGAHWSPFFTSRGLIQYFAPHPRDIETIYVAQGNRLLKTDDAGQTWNQVYLDSVAGQTITAVSVHPVNYATVFLGTSDGRVIKSGDSGKTWTLLNNFSNRIFSILLQKVTPSRVYVILATNGIHRSEDGGQFWDDVSEELNKYSGAKNMRQAVLLPGGDLDLLILANDYGLIRSMDGGLSYEPISLVTPPNQAPITSLAVNPRNGREIYYATTAALYRTQDGGVKWNTKRLPTDRAAIALQVDFFNPQIIYLGASRLDK